MLKKHIVHIPLTTYVEVVVYADESVSEDTILGKSEIDGKDYDEQVLNHLQYASEKPKITTENIFPDKDAAYGALCAVVDSKGGYLNIKNPNQRPTLLVENDDVEADGEPDRILKVKSLYQSDDESSPLKFIDENDESWDVDDYLTQAQITYLYAVLAKKFPVPQDELAMIED